MVYNAVRSDEDIQRFSINGQNGGSERLKRAVRLTEQNLEVPLMTHELATAVGASPRQPEQLFAKHLRTSPKRYYVKLRLRKALSLLTQTDAPMIWVALRCSFVCHSHITLRYEQAYGTTPLKGCAPALQRADSAG